MSQQKSIRVLIAKPGLDGHDRGARVIAYGLRDAGFEVIYSGLRQKPAQIANTAIQESVDVVGLSILSGAHVRLTEMTLQKLKEKGEENVLLIVGGIIPEKDIPKLEAMGVQGVFTAGTPIKKIAEFIRSRISLS